MKFHSLHNSATLQMLPLSTALHLTYTTAWTGNVAPQNSHHTYTRMHARTHTHRQSDEELLLHCTDQLVHTEALHMFAHNEDADCAVKKYGFIAHHHILDRYPNTQA